MKVHMAGREISPLYLATVIGWVWLIVTVACAGLAAWLAIACLCAVFNWPAKLMERVCR